MLSNTKDLYATLEARANPTIK
jgi:hypothetical protein